MSKVPSSHTARSVQPVQNLRVSPIGAAVRTVAQKKGSVSFETSDQKRQTWDDLEEISKSIRLEIQDMAVNLNEAVELVKVAGGVNPAEFAVAVHKTNEDLANFTGDFLSIWESHKNRTGAMTSDNDLADCLEIYEKYMQFKALFNGVFHHTAILFTEFSLQAKDAMKEKMIQEARELAEKQTTETSESKDGQ